jgi:hypothetical protein
MDVSTTFRWRIDQFSVTTSRDGPNTTLEGPVFKLSNGTLFFLHFDHTNKKAKGNCSLFLVPKELVGYKSVMLKFRLWIENNVGEELRLFNEVLSYNFDSLLGFGYPKIAQHDKLYGPSAKFVKDDVVIFCCEIQSTTPSKRALSSSESNLRDKMYSFYGRGSSDSCIIQVEKRVFNVSKAILMSQSKVFENMFNSGMQEEHEGKMKIANVSPTIMECFIKYLYLGNLDNLADVAKDLFYLADKYEVKDLKEECVNHLSIGFNKENVFERLQLAFMHNEEVIKKAVLAYVCDKRSEGNFNYILKIDAWKQFAIENEQLTDEITDAVFSKIY